MRNRSEGWSHAKREGHLNEQWLINMAVGELPQEVKGILKYGEVVENITGNGINEQKVDGVFGDKTSSKTDIILHTNYRKVNISLKKSSSGQVYLIGVDRFLDGMNYHWGMAIPDKVREGFKLFLGESDNVGQYLKNERVVELNSVLSKRQRGVRLNMDSLKYVDGNMVDQMIDFLISYMSEMVRFSFSMGLSKSVDNFAEYVYYKNGVQEDSDLSDMIFIDDLVNACKDKVDKISYGNRFGGSVIQLPFGHLQSHKNILQLHHNLKKIKGIL